MSNLIETTILILLMLLAIPLAMVSYNSGLGVWPGFVLQILILCRLGLIFARGTL
mgnify:FL=1